MSSIDRLIVIAAPSCCGKTTFINNLMNGELSSISEVLGMGDVASWEFKDAFFVDKEYTDMLLKRGVSKMLLHWTIPHPSPKLFIRNLMLLNAYDKKERLDILDAAKQIDILTLYAPLNVLRTRVQLRYQRIVEKQQEKQKNFNSLVMKTKSKWNIDRLYKVYSDPAKLVGMYSRWFDFCGRYDSSGNYLINVESCQPTIAPVSDWSMIRDGWLR